MDELPAIGTRVRSQIDEDDCSPEYFTMFDGVYGTVVGHSQTLFGVSDLVRVLPDAEWVINSQYLSRYVGLPLDFTPEELVLDPRTVTGIRYTAECENCGRPFKARAGAKTCSGRCRVAAHRAKWGISPLP